MDIHLFDHQTDLSLDHEAVRELVALVIQGQGEVVDEVAIHFISPEASSTLHQRYFQDSSPTDCMSFPMDGPNDRPRVLGEIFVCPRIALEYVQNGGSLPPEEEVALYIIHGLLHLFGYDDIEDADVVHMRAGEDLHLNRWRLTGHSVVARAAP